MENNLNSVERLRIGDKKWRIVNISNMMSPRRIVHGMQISSNEAIVFGGYDDIDVYSDCYLLDLCENKCKIAYNMISSDSFLCCTAPVSKETTFMLSARIEKYTFTLSKKISGPCIKIQSIIQLIF